MQNTIRYAVFLLILTGTLFTACKSESEEELVDGGEFEKSEPTNTLPSDTVDESSLYEDGTYTASGTYASPAGPENIEVTLTIKDDTVSSVSVTDVALNPTSKNFIELFRTGISSEVVGVPLNEIGNYSSVNGSSLTPNGFDLALASIKADAAL